MCDHRNHKSKINTGASPTQDGE
jgi:hypothetical protein